MMTWIQPHLKALQNKAPFLIWFGALSIFSFFFIRQIGYTADFSTHYAWAIRLADLGLRKFYEPGFFADYLPLYMYVLKALGEGFRLFNFMTFDNNLVAWLKVPSLLIYAGLGIYLLRGKTGWPAARTLIGLLSPAVIYNLFGFGQVDSILVALGTFWALCFLEKKTYLHHFLLVLLLTFKPQGIFFLPLYGLGTFYLLWTKQISWKTYGIAAISSALLVLLIFAPFHGFSVKAVVDAYFGIKDAYPYATVNAFNFHWLLGANWRPVDKAVLWGMPPLVVFILAGMAWFLLFYRSVRKIGAKFWHPDYLLLLGATSTLTVYVMGPRMHERYSLIAFPFILLLSMRHQKYLWVQLVFSVAAALNQAIVVDNAFGTKMAVDGPIAYFCSGAYVCAYAYLLRELWRIKTVLEISEEVREPFFSMTTFTHSLSMQTAQKALLWKSLGAIFVCASLFTFMNLGSTSIPEPTFLPPQQTSLTFSWADTRQAMGLWVYGKGGEGSIKYAGGSGKVELSYTNYYAWKETRFIAPLPSPATLTFDIVNGKPLSSMILIDNHGKFFIPQQVCSGTTCTPAKEHSLFSHSEELFHTQNFLYGTYFDEVYYARAIEELSQAKAPWENTHPALSKFLIYSWAKVTNFSPFNWRVVNAMFGVLCAVVIGWMGFVFFGPQIGLMAGLLGAFEFSRITISRISTIDGMVGFGILLCYALCFIVISQLLRRTLGPRFWLQVVLFAMALGFAVSIKWNAMFTLMTCGLLYGVSALYFVAKDFSWKKMFYLFAPMILLPPLLYWLSFQPFHLLLENGYSWERFLRDQKSMWDYHSQLKATHPFSAWYWTWPFLQKPMWFYTDTDTLDTTMYRSIAVFGNPLLWWSVIPVWIYLLQKKVMPHHGPLTLVFIAWSAQYFSWMPATRIIFLYHYFPSMMLSLIPVAYCLYLAWKEGQRRVLFGLGLVYASLFVMFFPIVTGMRVSRSFVDHCLRWFGTWYF